MHSTLKSPPPPLFYPFPFFCFFSTPFIPSTTSLLIEFYSSVGLPPTFPSPIATSSRSNQALFVLLAGAPKTRSSPSSPVPPAIPLVDGECRVDRSFFTAHPACSNASLVNISVLVLAALTQHVHLVETPRSLLETPSTISLRTYDDADVPLDGTSKPVGGILVKMCPATLPRRRELVPRPGRGRTAAFTDVDIDLDDAKTKLRSPLTISRRARHSPRRYTRCCSLTPCGGTARFLGTKSTLSPSPCRSPTFCQGRATLQHASR
ncbi:uncharacterized protein SCHCODRAFT_02703496 [Schizophyllum commune H4-8]|uniref:uncharacterized protein n=1 Tax=Schizophyllum commune (strain H4-8 / FGSC 9210) TaxID=578458 RepID=UPI00215F4E42|nr:uncharacterized protein SCHCODRAFT_02703496 [Schizophyllum commune H4-8]KAI5889044.1 hypothetical protein SCHCODRAFT_02703496 [Schizophyllum commune H4-8]